ncbi:MAG TPA: cytochrome c biogenesis protein CcsA [Solirubrobacteraceae bacterium]
MTLRRLAPLCAALVAVAYGLVFFYAPDDADQGVLQKIFYLHVPLAIVALCGFVAGGLLAGMYLRTGDRRWDLRSYVAIHVALILAAGTLVTGSIWARAAWGHWWVWDEPMLVSFLVIFLLYACYQPLRFAVGEPERQARVAAVFAVMAAGFVPVNFIAVRSAQAFTHPRVLSATGGNMPGSMRLTFVVCLVAMATLYVTLCRLELAAKRVRIAHARLVRREREAEDARPLVPLGAAR